MAELNNKQIEEIKLVIENVSREFNILCLQDFLTKEIYRINSLMKEVDLLKEELCFIRSKLMDHIRDDKK